MVSTSIIKVDRPAGSAHPRVSQFVYPVDYGYIEGTTGGDGEGVDVWAGSAGVGVVAMAWTVDLAKRNTEVKLFIGCSDHEIDLIQAFYDIQPQAATIIRRPRPPAMH